ncbi:MAG: galactose ABC transporter substrate-binding protein [Firmicutes bacterium]|nr:galactose ABC transporter substrate-binding protein [Bacillota bacterium]
MKKALILIMFLLLFGCQTRVPVIPLLIYDMNDDYMRDFESRIQEANLMNFRIETYDCQNSQIIQNEYLEEVLKKDNPLIIINPVDRLSAHAMIEKAKQTGAKIIFINREPLPEDMDLYDSVYYVGADAKQSAELQAEIIMDLFGGNPYSLNEFDLNSDGVIQAVILKGEQGHQDAEARTKYVIDELENEHYQVEVLDIAIANFDMDLAEIAMNQLIEEYGDQFEVVIANNDAMAIGAIKTLTEHQYFDDMDMNGVIDRDTEPWIPVVGIDGLDIAIESMNNGYLYGTVLNDSQSMAEAIVELANILLNNLSLDDFSYVITDSKYIWIDYQKFVNDSV